MSKSVIVTGGSRGLGRAMALKFADAGYDVAINYIKNEQAAADVAKEIEKLGQKALVIQADVSDFEAAGGLIKKAAEEFSSIDVLINNAGITKDGLLARMKEEEFDDVIRVNLKSAFNCSRHAISLMMKKKSGAIISLSSVAGVMGNPGQVNYAASKAGIIGMTKSIAREVAKRGISANAIAPGLIETDMALALPENAKEKLIEQIPMGRLGQPGEIANVALFLAENRYITGQTIIIDGGMAI